MERPQGTLKNREGLRELGGPQSQLRGPQRQRQLGGPQMPQRPESESFGGGGRRKMRTDKIPLCGRAIGRAVQKVGVDGDHLRFSYLPY